MEALELIGKLIVAVISLIALAYAWSWIAGGISKLFGTTMVSRSGTVISTPHTIDENIRDLKLLKSKFLEKINDIKRQYNSKKLLPQEKIKLLTELDNLKVKGIITKNEFESMKIEIMNM